MTKTPEQSLRRSIENITFYTSDGSVINWIHREHLDKIMELVEQYLTVRERAADVKTLETIAALLNGDDNQIEVVKNYVWNKLEMYHERQALKEGDK